MSASADHVTSLRRLLSKVKEREVPTDSYIIPRRRHMRECVHAYDTAQAGLTVEQFCSSFASAEVSVSEVITALLRCAEVCRGVSIICDDMVRLLLIRIVQFQNSNLPQQAQSVRAALSYSLTRIHRHLKREQLPTPSVMDWGMLRTCVVACVHICITGGMLGSRNNGLSANKLADVLTTTEFVVAMEAVVRQEVGLLCDQTITLHTSCWVVRWALHGNGEHDEGKRWACIHMLRTIRKLMRLVLAYDTAAEWSDQDYEQVFNGWICLVDVTTQEGWLGGKPTLLMEFYNTIILAMTILMSVHPSATGRIDRATWERKRASLEECQSPLERQRSRGCANYCLNLDGYGEAGLKLWLCPFCKMVVYCSKECMNEDRSRHSRRCRRWETQ